MGEVLEHVEQPEVFLRRIADLAKDDAYIFITTCINAPAVDHIYLWRTTDELEDDDHREAACRSSSRCGCPTRASRWRSRVPQQLPINVAYVLAKASTTAAPLTVARTPHQLDHESAAALHEGDGRSRR